MTTTNKVNGFLEALNLNVADWYANIISYEDFTVIQKRIWLAIESAGLRDAVLAVWRTY